MKNEKKLFQEILRELKSGTAGGVDGFHLFILPVKEQIERLFFQEFKFSPVQRVGWAGMFPGDRQVQVSQGRAGVGAAVVLGLGRHNMLPTA